MDIKAIFWDNDGILVETEHLYFQATRDALGAEGIEVTEEIYRRWFLVAGSGAYHLLREKGYPEEKVEQIRAKRNAQYAHLLQQQNLIIAGVKEVVQELSSKYLMGIVTSSYKDHFEIIHRKTELLQYFKFVLAVGDYENAKPAPDPYLAALKRANCNPEECIVVEDSARGLQAALAANLRCIVIPCGLTIGQDFTGAECVLSSIEELPDALSSL